MYRIRIFSSFTDTFDCKRKFESVCQTHLNPYYGPNKKYYITTDEDYTHVIILNTAMPVLKPGIPRENVLGFACEPRPFLNLNYLFIQYAMAKIGNYYIGDVDGLPFPFVEGNAYLWYNPPPNTIPLKRNLMSIMVSFKTVAPGHAYRHTLVKEILKQGLPVDIYGNGCKAYSLDSRVKGEFTLNEPYESYLFHITIENFQTNEYFSEKIVNPLLHESIPLYWGAKNIDKYFRGMYIRLTGNVEDDIGVIREVARNPGSFRTQYKPDAVQVEQTMNLFKNGNIERAFEL